MNPIEKVLHLFSPWPKVARATDGGVLFFSCLFLALTTAVQAKEIEKGMSFTKARQLLIAQQWKPFNVHEGKQYEYVGVEHALVKRYKEIENCAIDQPYCIFNYKKKDKCLRLVTFGEKNMRVYEWTNDCPGS